jgi:hypothetical protein
MIYKHIDGVTVTAQFAWEGELRFRYRLEIALKDVALIGKTAWVVMQNPSYAGEDVADKSVKYTSIFGGCWSCNGRVIDSARIIHEL